MRGLVLEGGGSKGAYHIGAYRAIIEEGVTFQGVVGTSIGAINGAFIAQGDFELLEEMWKTISFDRILDPQDAEIAELLADPKQLDLKRANDQLQGLIQRGGVNIGTILSFISDYVDEEKLRRSGVDYGLVTIDLTKRQPERLFIEDIAPGNLVNYLMASSYLPVFKREKLGGSYFLDGCFFDNLPFGMLLDRGYDELVLVRTLGFGIVHPLPQDIPTHIIKPSGDIGLGYEFEPKMIKQAIAMGYLDGRKSYGHYLGEDYFFKTTQRELDGFLEKLLLHLRDSELEIGEKVGREALVKELHTIYRPKEAVSLPTAILEDMGKRRGVDRLREYTLESFFAQFEKELPRDESHLEAPINPIDFISGEYQKERIYENFLGNLSYFQHN